MTASELDDLRMAHLSAVAKQEPMPTFKPYYQDAR